MKHEVIISEHFTNGIQPGKSERLNAPYLAECVGWIPAAEGLVPCTRLNAAELNDAVYVWKMDTPIDVEGTIVWYVSIVGNMIFISADLSSWQDFYVTLPSYTPDTWQFVDMPLYMLLVNEKAVLWINKSTAEIVTHNRYGVPRNTPRAACYTHGRVFYGGFRGGSLKFMESLITVAEPLITALEGS